MSCLSDEQIEIIRNELKSSNISRSILFEEWFDHVCCDVETLMNRGTSFEEALSLVSGAKRSKELKSAHNNVQQFLNHRYVRIKKFLLLAFLVFAASWIINLEGTGKWIGLGSFLLLGIVYLRITLDFIRKRFVHRINLLLSVFSSLSFLLTISGILLIFLNRTYGLSTRGHGVDLCVFGWFFFSLLCLIYYVREYRSAIENRELKRFRWFIRLSGFNVFLAAISIASFPLYHQVQAYLFFLILFILGFNLLVFTVLLFTRSLKSTLILSLVIGSFMIVFIHSHFRYKLPGGKPKLHELTLQVNTGEDLSGENLYISMFYDQFPDKPITLPLRKMDDKIYAITMPSYPYRGYLYYAVIKDSLEAKQFFSQAVKLDSIALSVPRKKQYDLIYNKE